MKNLLEIEQRIPVPPGVEEKMQHVAACCLIAEGVALPVTVQVILLNDEEIRAANLEYRGIDRATDVLSFPTVRYPKGQTARQAEKQLRKEWDAQLRACFLGDILISLPHAAMQAEEYGHSLERELMYLLTHGLFHLMGYDHLEPDDKRSMRTMEEKALNAAGLARVTDDELVVLAKQAMAFAHVPYSHFKVGACLLAADGRVFTGCNIENASYGVTNCAERTALYKAVSEGVKEFVAVAVVAEQKIAWPCGICRQALYEFAPGLRVIVACGEERDEALLAQLLPHGFRLQEEL